jgi:hypothetical protein
MDAENVSEKYTRDPTVNDLVVLCLNAEGLLRTKQTYRSDDVEDRMYLEELLGKQSGKPIQRGNPIKEILRLFWNMLTKWFRW